MRVNFTVICDYSLNSNALPEKNIFGLILIYCPSKRRYEVHAHSVWTEMVQWRFLPIFLLIYHHCISPSDKTSNLGVGLQSFYTFSLSLLQKFVHIYYVDFELLKHPDMKWLICRSMLWYWLTWECCNHFHLIFRCSQTLARAQTSEREFWTIRFHHPSISNTNKTMLFDKRQKKKRNFLNVWATSQVFR